MAEEKTSNFIRTIIDNDRAAGKHGGRVHTRFPPEPNGYLHIGHAKSICLNFGIAQQYDGLCNLRFDDTNPTTEDVEYVDGIQRDIRWLGFDWEDRLFYASDYFEQLYGFAVKLVKDGKAYVCELSEEEIRDFRGTVTTAGRPSPWRDRPIDENLDLLARMRAGEFADGERTLRAKIDMAHPNMKMRDPLIYRIRRAHHYRSGDRWCIYPMYDFAHCLSDAIEGITHSLCTLEFENNRALYDWFVDHVQTPHKPRQIEFARLNLAYTITSKRKLRALVEESLVSGWDDPRMPTIAGYRRRGYTPASIRAFSERVGVAKANSTVDPLFLENAVRDDLNTEAPRVMAVLDPLEVVIDNWPGGTEQLEASYWPHDVPKEGSRQVPFSGRLYIERDDFREDPPKKYRRLAPGREVRLRYGYFVRCVEVEKDDRGEVVRLRCTYDPETRGGSAPDGRKVKGTIHWVDAEQAVQAEVRLYDRLFQVPHPGRDQDWRADLNPASLQVVTAHVEPSLREAAPRTHWQFERLGYFFVDPEDGPLVFNRVVSLKDSWAKLETEAPQAKKEAPRPRVEAERDPTEGMPPAQVARFERYRDEVGLSDGDAEILARNDALAKLFDDTLLVWDNARGVANWIVNELLAELKDRSLDDLPFGATELGSLVRLFDEQVVSSAGARTVLAHLVAEGGDPELIVEDRGLKQISDDGVLAPLVDELLAAHPDKADAYRAGRTRMLGFFVGQVMQRTKGKADPRRATELLEERLSR